MIGREECNRFICQKRRLWMHFSIARLDLLFLNLLYSFLILGKESFS